MHWCLLPSAAQRCVIRPTTGLVRSLRVSGQLPTSVLAKPSVQTVHRSGTTAEHLSHMSVAQENQFIAKLKSSLQTTKEKAKQKAQEIKQKAKEKTKQYKEQLIEDPIKGSEKGAQEKEKEVKAPAKKEFKQRLQTLKSPYELRNPSLEPQVVRYYMMKNTEKSLPTETPRPFTLDGDLLYW